jgi:hypothetical protein
MDILLVLICIVGYEIYLHIKTAKAKRIKKDTLINFYSRSLDDANDRLNKLL